MQVQGRHTEDPASKQPLAEDVDLEEIIQKTEGLRSHIEGYVSKPFSFERIHRRNRQGRGHRKRKDEIFLL